MAATPPVVGDVLVPVTLELAPIRFLLILDVADDPTYRTLEPQVLDGPHGPVVVLLAYRHDGRVELYAPPDHDPGRAGYDGLGEGLDGIHDATFDAARIEVTADGLQLEVVLAATNGRRFVLHLHERLAGARDRFPALAPVGGSFETPTFFPFLWLPGLSFVPVRDTALEVRIDGQARRVPRLPLPIGGRRCLMARYDPDVLVCQVNPAGVTEPARVPVRPDGGATIDLAEDVEVVERAGGVAVAAVRVARGGHRIAAVLTPALPDLSSLPEGAHRSGVVALQVDDVTHLQARYGLVRTGDRVELVIDRFGPWRTRLRRPLLAVLFRLPLFRRWPTTYRWTATVHLDGAPRPRLASRWERTGGR